MKGWWSQVSANVSLPAWSVMSKMVESCWFPAVGAAQAASRMARRASGGMGRSRKARTDLRAWSWDRTSFIKIPPRM